MKNYRLLTEFVSKNVQSPIIRNILVVVAFLALIVLLFETGSKGTLDDILHPKNLSSWGGLLATIIVIVVGVIGVSVYEESKIEKSKLSDEIKRLSKQLQDRDADALRVKSYAKILEDEKLKIESELNNPKLRVITKSEYLNLLETWNASGPGVLLGYNLELQSFESEETMEKVWGPVMNWENIREIQLCMPRDKLDRWAKVIVREREKFFKKHPARKFFACEARAAELIGDKGEIPNAIGFAMYRNIDVSQGNSQLHQTALVFVLSQPFSSLEKSFVNGDSDYWNYHHVLQFTGDVEIINNCNYIWRNLFSESRRISIEGMLQRNEPLVPMGPEELLRKLKVPQERVHVILDQFKDRRIRNNSGGTLKGANGEFSLLYDNGDEIEGHYVGRPTNGQSRKQAMIWVGGFTEKARTALPKLFRKRLKTEAVVQFYYQVSSPVEHFSLTRYRQDMREVLRFVNRQTDSVEPNKIIVVARSVNGMLAAHVAADDEFRSVISGLILVAPVFDIRKTLNNYRRARGHEGVSVEACWRCLPEYPGEKWEDPERGWLEYFNHHLSLTLFADIIQHPPNMFDQSAFVEAVGRVSQKCPVYVLSNPDDPIVGSREAIQALNDAAGGGGLIRTENFESVEIQSSHLPPNEIRVNMYPYLRDEIDESHVALNKILNRLGIPSLPPS